MFHSLQALTCCYIFTFVQFRPASPRGVIIKLWERVNKQRNVAQFESTCCATLDHFQRGCYSLRGSPIMYLYLWYVLDLFHCVKMVIPQPFSGCASTFQKGKSVKCTLHSNWTAKNLLSCTYRPSSHQPWQCEIENLGQLEAEVWGWWEIAASTLKFVRTGHLGRDLKIAATLEAEHAWEDELMRLAKYKSGKAFKFYEYVRKLLIKFDKIITDA